MQTFKRIEPTVCGVYVIEEDEQGVLIKKHFIESYYVVERLATGGSFYTKIAEALQHADQYNFNKLIKTFDSRILKACEEVNKEYWKEIEEDSTPYYADLDEGKLTPLTA